MDSSVALAAKAALGVAAFAATNLDDLFLLAAFFADMRLRRRSIVAGQFLGIGTLVAASAAAATLAWAIPPGWVALLGVVPLGLGLRGIARQRRRDEPAGDGDPLEVERATERRTHSQALAVGAVTVAHGGDNLGVYIPLFASDLPAIAVYATVFAAMTALWCALGHALARNRWIEGRGDRVARSLLPWVLVGLGIYILSGARALA